MAPTNTRCDGVNTPCIYVYPANGIGEQTALVDDALANEAGDTNPFATHFDDAPNFFAGGPAGSTSPPGPYDPAVRQLEQDLGNLTLVNQQTGATEQVTQHLADAADQTILHMTMQDPLRTPTFTDFGDPTFFYQTGSCSPTDANAGCPVVNPGFAWNHGGEQPEVARTWLGIVGPTINNLGETGSIWSDHTDIRPTMLALLGLQSDYQQDGRALAELMSPSGLPAGVSEHLATFEGLAGAYKQLDASVGQFGHDSEIVSTVGSESVSPGDVVARGFDQQLSTCHSQRDAYTLIGDMHSLSQMVVPPAFTVCPTSPAQGSPGPQGPPGPEGP